MSKRVVQVSYYSTRKPVSGGQKRIAALREGLGSLGLQVHPIEVFAWMEVLDRDDFKFSSYDDEWARRFPGEYETRVAAVLRTNKAFSDQIVQRIGDYKPDLLWLEQPFLWPFFSARLQAFGSPRVVYSSHNIEWQVRRDLQERLGGGLYASERIRDLECELVHAADLVIAASEPDLCWYERAGARKTVLVRNAASAPERSSDPSAGAAFRTRHRISDDAIVFLYVSAYWEPNWLGLAEWCLPALQQLAGRRTVRLLLVGGIGKRASEASLPQNQSDLITALGEVPETEKDAAYGAADAVLLPIITGGGTNLKSAEALLSGLPVIASEFAMRGLERFSDLASVFVCENAAAFATALDYVAGAITAERSGHAASLRRTPDDEMTAVCSWTAALSPLRPEIALLTSPPNKPWP